MFVVNSYSLAVIFCFITMLCWGSWGNTQKLAGKTWRYELFYWDYVIGMVLFAILLGFTMGSIGTEGRPFLEDLAQAEWGGIGSVVLGGVIFNASNILLSASVSLAGLSVAFPLGVGLALVLGVIVNYVGAPKGDPVVLFLGVALIVVAIICNGIASGRMRKSGDSAAQNRKGIILAVVAGVLMSFFYRFVAAAMDLDNFAAPTPGMLTPYSAIFVFSVGVLLSNFVFNTIRRATITHTPKLSPPGMFSDHASSRDNPPLSALSFSLLFFLSSPPFPFFSPLPSLPFLLSFFLPLFRPQHCAEDVVRSPPSRFPASFPFFFSFFLFPLAHQFWRRR